jgi:hypothetical protein
MTQAEERVKLSGFCRCKEGKKNYEPPSIGFVARTEMVGRLNEGSKVFCPIENLVLPGYRTPPMKPPPTV